MKAWIFKHWRGEYSLAYSFWVNVVAINLAFTLPLRWASADYGVTDPLTATRVHMMLIGVHVMIFPWQFVGLWRSARYHRAHGDTALWGWLACAFFGLGIIVNLANGISNSRLIGEMLKIAMGLDPEHAYTLRVLDGGKVLALYGGIAFGVADDVAAVLRASPTIHVIHLNSGGGRVVAARQLYTVIREAGLDTYTRWGCASACTLAFLAGKERSMHIDTHLAFHHYATVGEDPEGIANQHDMDRRILLDAGVPTAFIERAFATPHDDLWLPDQKALYAANVITRPAGTVDQFDDQHKKWYVESAEAVLSNNPMLAAVYAVDPVVHSRYREWLRARFSVGDTLSVIQRDVARLLSELFSFRVGFASDEAVIELGRVVLRELKFAAKQAPVYCDAFQGVVSPSPMKNSENQIDPELIALEQQAVANVIASSNALPRPEIADERTRTEFLRVVKSHLEWGSESPRTMAQSKATCMQLVITLESMLVEPKSKAAALLRYWLRFHTLESTESSEIAQ